ncbi:hypothetical protein KL933_003683 [Ogataea haglerorum]|uniref:Uncharacterized protein n=1 Tax=Ogataea haglerorum TaxID=1937702 RepID=A0AAN6I0C1_9ASCO|nr:hypothetical protein KL915_003463 [Ogataea haglerorum]KAG7705425.1 hypothetical protein KL950_003861 [Ogataea haglerorum]KAG7716706.1 hypothetical protein KL913_003222 [Ogataea haglerorum]KAG7717541.1 hypothetical protein KL949_003375 [Ogataea haglerorum]KAG7726241.1 hypothetical protein KL933_003683 [Ogataea haglerorum]
MTIQKSDSLGQYYHFNASRHDRSAAEADSIGEQLFTSKKSNWFKSMMSRKRRSKNLGLTISGTNIKSMPMVSRFERRNNQWRERQKSMVAEPPKVEEPDTVSLWDSRRQMEREMRKIRRANGDEEHIFRETFFERSNNDHSDWPQKASSRIKLDHPKCKSHFDSKFTGNTFDQNLKDYMWYNNGVRYSDRKKGLENRRKRADADREWPQQTKRPELHSTIYRIHDSIQSSLQFVPVIGVVFQLFGILYSVPILPPEAVLILEIFTYLWMIRIIYRIYQAVAALLQPFWKVTQILAW